jgi:hypothetical protein
MTSKHPKLNRPTNVDLLRNPLIGGSKGVTMAQATPEDLEALQGENTIEGDVENDTNLQGGIDKADAHGDVRDGPPRKDRGRPSRRTPLQGEKTHAHERKPDLPSRPRPKSQAGGERSGPGARIRGKGAGAGAMTDLQDDLVGENEVLSNRDKVQESGDRGQDGKWIQTEQLEDHAANKGRG